MLKKVLKEGNKDRKSALKSSKKEDEKETRPEKVHWGDPLFSNLFISTKVTKELKIGKLSPEWRLSVFSKYSIKFIYFYKGH